MKRTVVIGAVLCGLALSACGSSSSVSLPPAPSYAMVQANLTVNACRIEQPNQPPYFLMKVSTGAQGPQTVCALEDPAVNSNPPTTTIRASCDYDITRVAIGYTFSCVIQESGLSEIKYDVQLQTPQEDRWWYVASNTAETEPPEEIRSVSFWEAHS